MTKKNDNLIKMQPLEYAKYYLLSLQYTDKDGVKTSGNVRVINNKFVFEGDVEESANLFFNVTLKKLVDDYLKARAEYTEKPYIKEMKKDCFTGYRPDDHDNADCILLAILRKLGYTKLVDLYCEVEKWYG